MEQEVSLVDLYRPGLSDDEFFALYEQWEAIEVRRGHGLRYTAN